MKVAQQIADAVERYTVIVNKSTVPVGTAARMQAEVAARTEVPLDVVSNPEFLKEGAAIDDFQRPGSHRHRGVQRTRRGVVAELYAPFVRTESPIYFMDPASAELTSTPPTPCSPRASASSTTVANLCERVGADVDAVRKALGADKRIGHPSSSRESAMAGRASPRT